MVWLMFFCFVRVLFLCYSRVVILLCRCDLKTEIPKSTLLMDNLPNSTRRSCDIDVLESFNIAVWLTCMTNNFIQPSSNPSYLIAFFWGANTYLYSARPLMQRMTWGAGKDHGTAMPQTAPSGAVEIGEDEKTTAALAAKEFLSEGWIWGKWTPLFLNKNNQKIPKLGKTKKKSPAIDGELLKTWCSQSSQSGLNRAIPKWRSRLFEAELWHSKRTKLTCSVDFSPFESCWRRNLLYGLPSKLTSVNFAISRAIFKSLSLNFLVLISEPLEYIPCTCKYDLKSFNSNSCHCCPKCNIAALPLEIEVIRCDPIVRGRRNSCRHCAVAWTSTAQLWMKVGRWNASRTWFQFLEFRLMFQHVPTGSLMIFDTFSRLICWQWRMNSSLCFFLKLFGML